eukprot:2291931-Pyramimonas_sp.AAC.1
MTHQRDWVANFPRELADQLGRGDVLQNASKRSACIHLAAHRLRDRLAGNGAPAIDALRDLDSLSD